MKLTMVVITLLLSATVQASFFQEDCSSASQSVVFNSGHLGTELSVKYYQRQSKDSRLELDRGETFVEFSNEQTIKSESYNSCDHDPNAQSGYASWDEYTVKDIVITNNDGSEFPSDLRGLSNDKKSISETIFCHRSINNQVMCSAN